MNILITNIDGSGLDTLICDTQDIDATDVWLMLTAQRRTFDDVKELETAPSVIPENTSLMWYTPRGEYELRREMASRTPELATFFPPWEVLHPKKRAARK